MANYQPGILAGIPTRARFVSFAFVPEEDVEGAIEALWTVADGQATVVGFGSSLLAHLGAKIPGMRGFPSFPESAIDIPSTPHALWLWLRGEDAGEILHRYRALEETLGDAFQVADVLDAFRYRSGHDLTGYEDGTENPVGDSALETAFASSGDLGGSSFVAVQQWAHDLDRFEDMSTTDQDHTFGRRKSDNEELEDAPESAHVKRTAQESFDPEAFLLRRSMPWIEGDDAGLQFLAFGSTLDPFEAQLRRMVGADDGITDALFEFSHPVSGSYYWCPGMKDGKLDLGPLGASSE